MPVVFREELPTEGPSVLPVLSLVDPTPFPALLAKLTAHAAALGRGPIGDRVELRFADPWSTLRFGDDEVAVHTHSGALRSRRIDHDVPPPYELSDNNAVGIATDFAARVGLRKDEVTRPRLTHLRIAGHTLDGGILPERVLDAEVVFRRSVDGVTVIGPGGLLAVRVAGDAAVIRSQLAWRSIRSVVTRVAIQRPDDVRRAFMRLATSKRGDVTVISASLGYFEFGVDDHQSFLQPAYALIYEVRDADVGYRSAFVQHAGGQVFERLAGVRRFSAGPVSGQAEPRPAVAAGQNKALPMKKAPNARPVPSARKAPGSTTSRGRKRG